MPQNPLTVRIPTFLHIFCFFVRKLLEVNTLELLSNCENYKSTEAQLLELNSAFFETFDQVDLCTKNANATQRDLCISFARKFNNLNNAQIEEIKKIWEVSNK